MRPLTRSARPAVMAVFILVLGMAAVAGFAQAMSTVTQVDGTIAAVNGDTIKLTLANGVTKTVAVRPATLVSRIERTSVADIKAGDALGVTSRRESDGSLTALRINIFSPEVYKVVPKKEFVMTTGNTMTNAVVRTLAKADQGNALTVDYPNGTSTISVADDVPVFRMVAVKEADLKEGLHVVVRGTQDPDGTLRASMVSFDQPMKG
jgi:hypothetical protein